MLSAQTQAALGGYGQYAYSPAANQLQSQLQAVADRNRDRQQLGLPSRPVSSSPGSMSDNFLLVAILGMLG